MATYYSSKMIINPDKDRRIKYGVRLRYLSNDITYWTTCYDSCEGEWRLETIEQIDGVFTTFDLNTAFRHRAHCQSNYSGAEYRVEEIT